MLLREDFYKARLQDLAMGATLYYKAGDAWRPMTITRNDLVIQPTGQNNLAVIISNLLRFERHEEDYYRVKLLDGDDIESLGFFYKIEADVTRRVYTNTRFDIVFYPKNRRIDIFENYKVPNKDVAAVKEKQQDLLFTGQILNLFELTTILKTTGVMFTPERKEMVNRRPQ